MVTARYVGLEPDAAALTAKLEALVKDSALAGDEIWTAVDPASMPILEEEGLRGGDKNIKGALHRLLWSLGCDAENGAVRGRGSAG